MRCATFLLAIGLVAGCQSTPAPSAGPSSAASILASPPQSRDVPTYHGDAARTGVMPGPGPLEQPELLWKFQAEGGIGSSPAVVGGSVFVASEDGAVQSLAFRTGALQWKTSVGGELSHQSPLVIDGKVIVGDRLGIVHALDASTGVEAWRTSTDGPIDASGAGVGDTVFVATESGTAFALAVATGLVRWQSKLPGGVTRSLAATDALVYCALSHGKFNALRVSDGTLAWEAQFTDDGEGGTPTVAEGLVFAAAGLDSSDEAARALIALDAATGAERWRRKSPEGETLYGPAVRDGVAYIVAEDSTVVAVDAQSGELRWTADTGAPNDALPSIWDRLVFVGTTGGSLQAFDIETGIQAWEVRIVGVPYSPVVTGGLVLLGTNVGVLYAFGEVAA